MTYSLSISIYSHIYSLNKNIILLLRFELIHSLFLIITIILPDEYYAKQPIFCLENSD